MYWSPNSKIFVPRHILIYWNPNGFDICTQIYGWADQRGGGVKQSQGGLEVRRDGAWQVLCHCHQHHHYYRCHCKSSSLSSSSSWLSALLICPHCPLKVIIFFIVTTAKSLQSYHLHQRQLCHHYQQRATTPRNETFADFSCGFFPSLLSLELLA